MSEQLDPEADLISSLRQQLAQARLELAETQAALRQRDEELSRTKDERDHVQSCFGDEIEDANTDRWVAKEVIAGLRAELAEACAALKAKGEQLVESENFLAIVARDRADGLGKLDWRAMCEAAQADFKREQFRADECGKREVRVEGISVDLAIKLENAQTTLIRALDWAKCDHEGFHGWKGVAGCMAADRLTTTCGYRSRVEALDAATKAGAR